MQDAYKKLVSTLNQEIEPLHAENKYAALLDKIGDARFVLMGEATHGTHEFYQMREEISQLLIEKKGFMAIAIEGDWPDAHRVHRYLQGEGDKDKPELALEAFTRFPIWMWRNTTLPPFLNWLRQFNEKKPLKQKIGFYGLDLYSLYSSIDIIIQYLEKVDPEGAQLARARYACFDLIKADPQTYGYLVSEGLKKDCVDQAIEQLMAMQQLAFTTLKKSDLAAQEELFFATQNARLVKNAERYYRSMFEGHILSWNIRDTHMAETLNVLADHLENLHQKPAKIIVWAHNSHIGDARATEMGMRDEINLGQLVREQHDNDTYLLGFSTYQGFVTAANNWDEPAERKRIMPGLPGSYEALFHDLNAKNFLLDLHNKNLEHYLHIPRLYRAIGVIYRPETERDSHYFFTRLPYQYDSIIHIDTTSAVKPLKVNPEWQEYDLQQIY